MNRIQLTLLNTLIVFTVFISSVAAAAAQNFPNHLYDPRTITEFNEIHSGVKDLNTADGKHMMISAKPFYSAIRVEYTGKSRKISDEKLTLFKIWQESLNINADVLKRLDNEYLFKDCEGEYWIPVQNQLAEFFPKELKAGDLLTIYTMAVGGVRPGDKWEFVFLTNEFQKY